MTQSFFKISSRISIMLKISILLILLLDSSFAAKIGQRIVGGQEARSGQFPFSAGINITTDSGRFFCGGSLYSDQWVITAGQCVYGATLFTISLGSNKLIEDDPNRVVVATSTYVIHPDFNPDTLENDIGLIQLRIPIEFTDYIQPIHTLPGNNIQPNYVVLATGWGQTSDDHPELIDHLRWVAVTSLSNDECRITYGNQIKDTMLCTAGNYNEGLCVGDIGSPLVELVKTGNGCLTGIASFISGNGCDSPDPSGYTRVFWYRDWIRNVTGG